MVGQSVGEVKGLGQELLEGVDFFVVDGQRHEVEVARLRDFRRDEVLELLASERAASQITALLKSNHKA